MKSGGRGAYDRLCLGQKLRHDRRKLCGVAVQSVGEMVFPRLYCRQLQAQAS
jgi:hypothetical protein